MAQFFCRTFGTLPVIFTLQPSTIWHSTSSGAHQFEVGGNEDSPNGVKNHGWTRILGGIEWRMLM